MTVPHTLTFDASPSARSTDENGFLHVASSHITKATVNPYYGREIPGWREAGLDPEAVYYGFRDPEELKKSLSTWQGLPLHIEHHVDSAEEPARLTRVGAVGRADWNAPYVDAPLTVWDGEAIAAIEDGSFRELSCAYRYDPDFTPGRYEGVEYDFIMRNIRGNHVALVEEGRAGPDVVVADANTVIMDGKIARLGDLEHLIALCKENGLTLSIQPEMARDDRWITVHPNGANNTGRPALIDENGTIKAGMGGKFNGRNIDDVPRGKNPHPVTEEKYQARQQRQAQKQKGSSSPLDVSKLSDQEIDDRMSSIGGAWHRATDAEKEEYYAIKRELDKRRKEKNAELDRKRDERRASPEYQAELKRREEAAARRDHVREREREVTSSTYKRAQARLHKPFDDRLKGQLGYKGQAHDAAFEEGEHPEKRQKKESPASGVGNKPTVGGDSTGFQPAVDLNIAIKPVRVNPQPDADTTRNPKLIQGAFMGKLKRWFRGAQDDNPEIEKQEVELAQAIIDLHKVDPVTGEIVDITEDEDKAEEIRRLIGELSAKLDPEEVKKLTDSLTDLACSRATGDERKTDAMDEEMKKAMDKCGLDAEDPTASQAFAEGVRYGEELERNPEERRRLDREHESEGMKKAMDACGLDAENPAESRAFAEGVKYGEELIRNPEERRKLDREHEAAGMKKAMGKDEDKNAAITRILDDVPDLTPEQRKRLFDSLQDLAYSPATGDADPSEVKTAQDRAFRSPRHLTAMDAARIKASAIAEAQDHMRGLHQAVRDVRGLVGDLDPLSFDSASDVYGYALKQSGIDPRRYPRQAWRGMIDMLRAGKTAALSGGMARDAAPARLDGKFAGLNNISLAD